MNNNKINDEVSALVHSAFLNCGINCADLEELVNTVEGLIDWKTDRKYAEKLYIACITELRAQLGLK